MKTTMRDSPAYRQQKEDLDDIVRRDDERYDDEVAVETTSQQSKPGVLQQAKERVGAALGV